MQFFTRTDTDTPSSEDSSFKIFYNVESSGSVETSIHGKVTKTFVDACCNFISNFRSRDAARKKAARKRKKEEKEEERNREKEKEKEKEKEEKDKENRKKRKS